MTIVTAMATMAMPISYRFVPNKRGRSLLPSLGREAAPEGTTRRGLRCLVEEHPLDTAVRVEEVQSKDADPGTHSGKMTIV
jgi:hypothetical protein